MPVLDVNQTEKTTGGKGGLWGKIVGGLIATAGAIATPFTAGASSVLVPVGAALASTAAPLIGNAVDPLKQKISGKVPALQTYAKTDPDAQAAILQESMKSVAERPDVFASVSEQADTLQKMGSAKRSLLEMSQLRRRMV